METNNDGRMVKSFMRRNIRIINISGKKETSIFQDIKAHKWQKNGYYAVNTDEKQEVQV